MGVKCYLLPFPLSLLLETTSRDISSLGARRRPIHSLTTMQKQKEYTMFQEKKVEQPQVYNKVSLEDLTPNKGDSILFYLVHTPSFTGDDGDFMVFQGLKLNLDAKTPEELISSAEPISFPARSIFEREVQEGRITPGKLYRLEMNIKRGDLVKGKKVKYFHWNSYEQLPPEAILNQLHEKAREIEEAAANEQ